MIKSLCSKENSVCRPARVPGGRGSRLAQDEHPDPPHSEGAPHGQVHAGRLQPARDRREQLRPHRQGQPHYTGRTIKEPIFKTTQIRSITINSYGNTKTPVSLVCVPRKKQFPPVFWQRLYNVSGETDSVR